MGPGAIPSPSSGLAHPLAKPDPLALAETFPPDPFGAQTGPGAC